MRPEVRWDLSLPSLLRSHQIRISLLPRNRRRPHSRRRGRHLPEGLKHDPTPRSHQHDPTPRPLSDHPKTKPSQPRICLRLLTRGKIKQADSTKPGRTSESPTQSDSTIGANSILVSKARSLQLSQGDSVCDQLVVMVDQFAATMAASWFISRWRPACVRSATVNAIPPMSSRLIGRLLSLSVVRRAENRSNLGPSFGNTCKPCAQRRSAGSVQRTHAKLPPAYVSERTRRPRPQQCRT